MYIYVHVHVHICTSPRARTTLSQVVFGGCWNCRAYYQIGFLLLGEALDTRARARGRATRWKGSMPALAREPLIRVSRSFFASVRAIRNRASPGARRFRPGSSCGGLAATADNLRPPPLQRERGRGAVQKYPVRDTWILIHHRWGGRSVWCLPLGSASDKRSCTPLPQNQ